MNPLRRQAAASAAELNSAVARAGLDLDPLDDGWRITAAGEVLVQLRPLHPDEITQLAQVIRAATGDHDH
ncbi:hypothetical protein P3T37_005411 [Kitasatospora sp. MAA4]|uniref:hypothetical protein n=1 Tax=Kitasatospora sp. MAA4 TaxID=3035093 RepID=UPI0024770FC0|nr:hypothetical protein [Kitasatospora sp. MAA4]MDH6135992.1 hypothetical protein [Kitasatospora sp. MAA4]